MTGPTRRIGCIADDYTGACDVASSLAGAGLRVVQVMGEPAEDDEPWGAEVDAIVVALKTRTVEPAVAVEQSLAACRWLRGRGVTQLYFKVCSTFDSTPRGNIGPVLQALLTALQASACVVAPAFPANGRTVYQGHLFVGSALLSDSPMSQHPLTPMRDANLLRVLRAQWPGPQHEPLVGLLPSTEVRRGPAAIASHLQRLVDQGARAVIADALDDPDLLALGRSLVDAPVVCGSAGLAGGLGAAWGRGGGAGQALPPPQGSCAIVAGSCSAATQAQVAHFVDQGGAAWAVDPMALAAGEDVAGQALRWAGPRLASGPVLVFATAAPDRVQAVQQRLGPARAGELVEAALAAIARGLVQAGVGRLIVAGGETSGACVQALGIRRLQVGPPIDPGVPWCHARTDLGALHIALKSGNFGGVDFFSRAFQLLADERR